MRVTSLRDKALAEPFPGVRRAVFFDAGEGSEQLSLLYAEIAPGEAIPPHRHWAGAGDARHGVEEGFHVLAGTGTVTVGDEERPLEAGSFCVMRAGEFHTIRNTGMTPLRLVAAFASTNVESERKGG